MKDSYEETCKRKNCKVREEMEKDEKLAASLFEVCKLLKSQLKWTKDDKSHYKQHISTVFPMWRDNYPDQAVFPKLHVAV